MPGNPSWEGYMSEHLIGNLDMGLDAPGPQMKGFIWGILGDQAGSENSQTKPLATFLLAFPEAEHLSPKVWKPGAEMTRGRRQTSQPEHIEQICISFTLFL